MHENVKETVADELFLAPQAYADLGRLMSERQGACVRPDGAIAFVDPEHDIGFLQLIHPGQDSPSTDEDEDSSWAQMLYMARAFADGWVRVSMHGDRVCVGMNDSLSAAAGDTVVDVLLECEGSVFIVANNEYRTRSEAIAAVRHVQASSLRFGDYDVEARYDHFNHALFDGALPKITIRGADLEHVGADVSVDISHTNPGGPTYVPNSIVMRISRKYRRDSAGLDGLLLHEMIHVYFYTLGDFIEEHGEKFEAKRLELIAKSGINIPVLDDVGDLELSSSRVKTYAVLAVNDTTHGIAYALMSTAMAERNMDAIKDYLMQRFHGPVSRISVFRVQTPYWTEKASHTPLQRRVSHKMRFERLTDQRAIGELLESEPYFDEQREPD